jgi:ubiquinone biosynthesis accessory factor UbiK
MIPPNSKTLEILNGLAARVGSMLEKSPVSDMEKNLRQQLIAQLAKQGLVTREEYEIQVAMLARAQARLRELEAKIAVLEAARAAAGEH